MTDQLKKWQSEFGNEYVKRNQPDDTNILQREALFTGIFMHIGNKLPKTILEVGAGVGNNIVAINNLYRNIHRELEIKAVEPNLKAREYLNNINPFLGVEGDIFSIKASDYSFDMTFTSGVLIHIHPDHLLKAMQEMYRVTKNYILCMEYFNPTCAEIEYRGEYGMLWKNDFGAIWLDNFPLRCVGYGFTWKRLSGIDNLTWWLFEKVN